jgi:hypothetical protein
VRKITDHNVAGSVLDGKLEVRAIGEPGGGGANVTYEVGSRTNDSYIVLDRIQFQSGHVQEHGVNGLTNEVLVAILIDRLRGFQSGQYRGRENACALTHFEEGLMWLQKRTVERIQRGVEGTNIK